MLRTGRSSGRSSVPSISQSWKLNCLLMALQYSERQKLYGVRSRLSQTVSHDRQKKLPPRVLNRPRFVQDVFAAIIQPLLCFDFDNELDFRKDEVRMIAPVPACFVLIPECWLAHPEKFLFQIAVGEQMI